MEFNPRESELFRTIPNQSAKRFNSCLMQISKNQFEHRWIRTEFLIWINMNSDSFGLIRIENLVWVHLDWSIELSRIYCKMVCFNRDLKCFQHWFKNAFGMTRINSDWIPFRNFRQGCSSLRIQTSKATW